MEIINKIYKLFFAAEEPSPPKRIFKIEQIARQDFPSLAKTAREWNKIAADKEKAAGKGEFASSTQFHNCAYIAKSIEDNLNVAASREVFACIDEEGRRQGIILATVGQNGIHVNYLTTHPHNIRSPLNEREIGRVEGAGSSLMRHVEKIARELNKERISLCPLRAAKLFYQKMGYKEGRGGLMIKTIEKVAQVSTPLIRAAA